MSTKHLYDVIIKIFFFIPVTIIQVFTQGVIELQSKIRTTWEQAEVQN